MTLDIRVPIGMLFALIGMLLVLQGLLAAAPANPGSGGLNVDLLWGGVMVLFGLAMLALSRRSRRGTGVKAP